MFRFRHLMALVALAAVVVYAAPAPAQTIIDEWQSVKAPPAPATTGGKSAGCQCAAFPELMPSANRPMR